VHVNYTVTYDMDNCYLGRSAAESPGNFGEFHSVSRAVAMYVVWNSLPNHLRDPTVDSEQFRRDLKTYLFAGH